MNWDLKDSELLELVVKWDDKHRLRMQRLLSKAQNILNNNHTLEHYATKESVMLNYEENEAIMLDCCEKAVPECNCASIFCTDCNPVYNKKKKQETTMRNEPIAQITYSTEDAQRGHLLSRLSSARREKFEELAKTFKIYGPDKPKTLGELKERIKKGEFTFRTKTEDGKTYNDDYKFGWRDPAQFITFWKEGEKADQEGYEAAIKNMEKAVKDTEDTIVVSPPTDGLAALRAFESSTIH